MHPSGGRPLRLDPNGGAPRMHRKRLKVEVTIDALSRPGVRQGAPGKQPITVHSTVGGRELHWQFETSIPFATIVKSTGVRVPEVKANVDCTSGSRTKLEGFSASTEISHGTGSSRSEMVKSETSVSMNTEMTADEISSRGRGTAPAGMMISPWISTSPKVRLGVTAKVASSGN